ncbi:unnamed protein product [Cunninghamella blakesleeana]
MVWHRLKTGIDVHSFMGIVNYFREHTLNITKLLAPLNALKSLQKSAIPENRWDNAYEHSFKSLKIALMNNILLKHPDLNTTFRVTTSTSNTETVHKALAYLRTQKIAISMMINWLVTILRYNFQVIHLPGLENILPNY